MVQSALLLHSPADILARVLVDKGLASLPPGTVWPVQVGQEASKPDNVVTVYDTTGQGDGRAMVTGERYQHYGIQVRVRGANHSVGYPRAQAIAVALDEDVYEETVVIGGSTYLLHSVTRTSEVLSLGKENPTSHRNVFTINLLACVRLVS